MPTRSTKPLESRLGRRFPKRLPTKHLRTAIWLDWPYDQPPGRAIRPYVKSARLREEREAWRVEDENDIGDCPCGGFCDLDDFDDSMCPWCLSNDCLSFCENRIAVEGARARVAVSLGDRLRAA